MIIWFVLLFMLIVMGLVLPSLIGKKSQELQHIEDSFSSRQQQLKSDYQFRRKELKRRFKIGDVDEDELSQLNDELDRETASSIQRAQSKGANAILKRSLLLGMLFSLTIMAISATVYWRVGNPELSAERERLLQMLAENPTTIDYLTKQAEVQKNKKSAIELLHAARLLVELKPFAPSSWLQFGEVEASFGRTEQSILALRRARQLDPKSSVIKLALSKALLSAQGEQAPIEGMLLEKDVLRSDPNNRQALLSLGFSAFQAQKYQQAIDAWEKVLGFTQTSPEKAQILHQAIATARSRLGAAQTPDQENTKKEPNSAAMPMASVVVKVNISDAIKAKLKGSETLFVFAKAASGPPIPLAVARFPINKIPVQITLSDKDAMRPELKLSSFNKIKLSARISISGNAIAKAGDFEGNSDILTAPFKHQTFTIEINRQL